MTREKSVPFIHMNSKSAAMVPKKKKKKRKKKSGGGWGNFMPKAAPGCYIVHDDNLAASPWTIGIDDFFLEDFGLEPGEEDAIPDISVDPETGLLSCVNKMRLGSPRRSFFISLGCDVFDSQRQPMPPGHYRDDEGVERQCVTLVVVLGPQKIIELCYVQAAVSTADATAFHASLNLYSDITDVVAGGGEESCGAAESTPRKGVYSFPLDCNREVGFLCTQGMCGCFTHFYPNTQHAIDLECPVGTPVLAIGDGKVVDILESNTVSGIHASNLYKWNSLMIALADGNFVEYVHIKTNSVQVQIGDMVTLGQHLCDSGDVGCCPRPHLHIQMHSSSRKDAPTIPFEFSPALAVLNEGKELMDSAVVQANSSVGFVPVAGKRYNAWGELPVATASGGAFLVRRVS